MTPRNKRGYLYLICAVFAILQSKLANTVILPYVHTSMYVQTVNFKDIVQKYADHSPVDFYLLENLKKAPVENEDTLHCCNIYY
jgi:hypothetical protein